MQGRKHHRDLLVLPLLLQEGPQPGATRLWPLTPLQVIHLLSSNAEVN
jgi:hypothetical protein